jgi:hypothetical protein
MGDEALSPSEEVALQDTIKHTEVVYTTSADLCATSMNLLSAKPTKKMAARADFICCHPWHSPFGPAKAVLIYSL